MEAKDVYVLFSEVALFKVGPVAVRPVLLDRLDLLDRFIWPYMLDIPLVTPGVFVGRTDARLFVFVHILFINVQVDLTVVSV